MIPLFKFKIEGNSMYPTFKSGNVILSNRLSYLFTKPKVGDIIVLRKKKYIVKRITKINPSADGDEFFVVGDNKKESSDSREFGWIGRKDIVGKVIFKISNYSNF